MFEHTKNSFDESDGKCLDLAGIVEGQNWNRLDPNTSVEIGRSDIPWIVLVKSFLPRNGPPMICWRVVVHGPDANLKR